MTIVTLKFRNTSISLDCDDPDRIALLAEQYNNRLKDLSAKFHSASDLKLSLIAGLMLEDQLDTLVKRAESESDSANNETTALRKTFNDTVSQIADYIDHLANRVEKS